MSNDERIMEYMMRGEMPGPESGIYPPLRWLQRDPDKCLVLIAWMSHDPLRIDDPEYRDEVEWCRQYMDDHRPTSS